MVMELSLNPTDFMDIPSLWMINSESQNFNKILFIAQIEGRENRSVI